MTDELTDEYTTNIRFLKWIKVRFVSGIVDE